MTNKHHHYANNSIQHSTAFDSDMVACRDTLSLAAVTHCTPKSGRSMWKEKQAETKILLQRKNMGHATHGLYIRHNASVPYSLLYNKSLLYN